MESAKLPFRVFYRFTCVGFHNSYYIFGGFRDDGDIFGPSDQVYKMDENEKWNLFDQNLKTKRIGFRTIVQGYHIIHIGKYESYCMSHT